MTINNSLMIRWLVVLLGITLLFSTLEWTARKLFRASFTQTFQENSESMFQRARVAVFGSSHSLYGVDPAAFSVAAFNFSTSSQDLYYSYELVKRNLSNMPDLQHMVIALDYYVFGFDVRRVERFRVDDFMRIGIPPRPLLDVGGVVGRSSGKASPASFVLFDGGRGRKEHVLDSWLRRTSYFYKYRHLYVRTVADRVARFLGSRNKENAAPVFLESDRNPPPPTSAIDPKSRAFYHKFRCYDASLVPDSRFYLGEIIRLGLRKGVKAYIVVTPLTRGYKDALGAAFVGQFRENLQMVLAPFGAGADVRFIDFSDDLRFNGTDFIVGDPDHLNAQGASKFTRVLAEEMGL